ncbi:MAG: endopeptidase La [Bacilli bacterium]
MGNTLKNTYTLPVILTYGTVVFPDSKIEIPVKTEMDSGAVKEILEKTESLFLIFPLKKPLTSEFNVNNISEVGVIATLEKGPYKKQNEFGEIAKYIVIKSLSYVKLSQIQATSGFFVASAQDFKLKKEDNNASINAIYNAIMHTINESKGMFEHLSAAFLKKLAEGIDVDTFINYISSVGLLTYDTEIQILNEPSRLKRLEIIDKELPRRIEALKIQQDVINESQRNAMKSQNEYFLREQLKTIKEKLGDDNDSDNDEILKRVEENPYPQNIKDKVKKEIKKLSNMSPNSPEFSTSKVYIDTLINLPWYQTTTDNEDLKNVKEVLDKDHYQLEEPKKRIIEYLAVKKMTGNLKAPILCFYGPPGTGKTSLAISIAKALNRKFFKCSLGGVYDESEIRGHRRTYVASLPGKIIYGMQKCGVINPVFLLDEIDKLGDPGMKGDPSSALLEVLDPEQNFAFNDNYIEEPYDLSNVLFIATANTLDTIPAPLRDRLELINLSSYTQVEKLEIAKRHLLKKALLANGLAQNAITFTDEAFYYIIEHYTREAGVRTLERKISSIIRKFVVEMVDSQSKSKKHVTIATVKKFLGTEIFESSKKETTGQVGVVTGLAYTQYGGDILAIEVNSFHGKGALLITGSLGDVMKESCSIALDYIKANAEHYSIDPEIFSKIDIHIHVPEGGVPKDGPSAGVAITTAIISCLSNKQVNPDIAMTGEVTLRGNVLPIGGLKEKSMAAMRSGITTILVPAANKANVEELPQEVKDKLKIIYIKQVDDAVKAIFL